MKKLALLLAVVMTFSLVLTACGGEGSTPSTTPGTTTPSETPSGTAAQELSVCIGPNPDTIDPALNSAVDGATLIIHGFEGLYTLDENGTPIPGQAESCDVSDDGLTYTFHLRDGLKWSDGTPLTAEDFVWSWQRAIDPNTASDYAYMFESIAGYAEALDLENPEYGKEEPDMSKINIDLTKLQVKAIDEKTLEVKLVANTPYFLELTAFPTFSPVQKATVEANGEAWAVEAATYIGNGPYKMTEWVPSSHMTYVKNENYWNVDALGPDSIKFVLMEDDNSILSAYQTGDILFADSMPNDEIDSWRDKSDFYLAGQLGTYYISFNTQKEPLNNPLVRKALTLAVDRDYICKNIGKSGQQPAGAFVATGLTDASDPTKEFRDVGGDYFDPSAEAYEANLEEAKKALAEAGYPNGEGMPTIEYLYNEGTAHQQVGEALQNMWAKLGVNVNLVSQEWNTFLNSRKNGDYYIARNGWLGDYNDPISFLDMWITGGGNNDAQWSNAEYDKLISEVKSSSDPLERFEKMHKAEDIIFDEWMLCPIYYYVDLYLMSDKLEGAWASPLGYKYFMFASVKE